MDSLINHHSSDIAVRSLYFIHIYIYILHIIYIYIIYIIVYIYAYVIFRYTKDNFEHCKKIPCACIHRFTALIINLLGPLNHVLNIILHKL